MPLTRATAYDAGTYMAVALRPVANITTITITNIHIQQTNTRPARRAVMNLTIDGATYSITMEFDDEDFYTRDFRGKLTPATRRAGEALRGEALS